VSANPPRMKIAASLDQMRNERSHAEEMVH